MNNENIKDNFFNINSYIELLKDKLTICIKDYKKYNNGILVRHDVDFSLELAYKFSRFELNHNIKSTYYVLVTSSLYNIFSLESKKIITEMIKDGFEIGLHFDPVIYGNLGEKELLNKMNLEIEIFEKFYSTKIYSYSMHNPSLSGIYINNNSLINAYDSDIFQENLYISDSSFSFRNKNPKEFLKKSKNQRIQFLTHPIHFFSDEFLTYKNQVKFMQQEYNNKINLSFNGNKCYERENLRLDNMEV